MDFGQLLGACHRHLDPGVHDDVDDRHGERVLQALDQTRREPVRPLGVASRRSPRRRRHAVLHCADGDGLLADGGRRPDSLLARPGERVQQPLARALDLLARGSLCCIAAGRPKIGAGQILGALARPARRYRRFSPYSVRLATRTRPPATADRGQCSRVARRSRPSAPPPRPATASRCRGRPAWTGCDRNPVAQARFDSQVARRLLAPAAARRRRAT